MRKWFHKKLLFFAEKIQKKMIERMDNDWEHIETIYKMLDEEQIKYVTSCDNSGEYVNLKFKISNDLSWDDKSGKVDNTFRISKRSISMLKTLIREKKINLIDDTL